MPGVLSMLPVLFFTSLGSLSSNICNFSTLVVWIEAEKLPKTHHSNKNCLLDYVNGCGSPSFLRMEKSNGFYRGLIKDPSDSWTNIRCATCQPEDEVIAQRKSQ